MPLTYHRHQLAQSLAQRLLQPSPLDEGLRAGLFISGQRRTGKTTFLKMDLIPALEKMGALVIYVDLWSDPQANPADLVHSAIKQTLEDVQSKSSALVQRFKRVQGIDLSAIGFRLGVKLDGKGNQLNKTLPDLFKEVVNKIKVDVVVIVDEVQQAITTPEGQQLLTALKATRDAVNLRPDTAGYFLFIGTGSHRAQVKELTVQSAQAFQGATTIDYPLLGKGYVKHLLDKIRSTGETNLPNEEVALSGFKTLGCRPEEIVKALRQAITEQDPNQAFPTIASTLRNAAADIEIHKLQNLGTLATNIFTRIAQSNAFAKGLYSAEALQTYQQYIGRKVAQEEVQQLVNQLMAENLIMRVGHGKYTVSDPTVQQVWLMLQNMKNG